MPKCFSMRASLLSGAAVLFASFPLAVPATVAMLAVSPAFAAGGTGGSANNGGEAGGLGGTSYTGVAGTAGVASGNAASGGGGGGAGGGAGGAGGGNSGAGTAGAGGTAAAPNGAAGGNASSSGGGGGGGGGANGDGAGETALANTGVLAGGNGGAGGNGASSGSTGGGGGGAGGFGSIITGLNSVNSNSGTVTGGNGGAGGSGYGTNDIGGNGGDGGTAVTVTQTGATFTNTGTITGGAGGAAGTGSNSATAGVGGVGGIGIEGLDLTIVNSGAISGGMSGATTPVQADAILFDGGINSLTLDAGSTISGDVVAFSASDTLALGGAANASFNVSAIGTTATSTTTAAQYQNFGIFEKTGTSDWTLTGTTTAVTSWQILAGTLSIASDANLGASTGIVTLNGGTLQFTAAASSARAITIGTAGGIIDNDGNAVTLSGVLSGSGALTSVGSGTLILAGVNTYTGGTTISAGSMQVGNGGSTGSITGPVVDNATLAFDVDGATSEGGPISGSGGLVQEGAGVLTLNGTNTYTGGTTATAGLINFNAAANFGSAAEPNITLNGGGLQWASGTTLDISADVAPIGSNGATFDTNGNNVSFATALTGTGGVTKAGAGVLTFTVANTYSGGTTVTGGLINFSALSNFGTAAQPSITLNGGGLQWASGNTLDISPDLTAIGSNGGTFDTDGNNVTLAGVLSGAGGVTKVGTGTLTLTSTETYSGGTIVSGGTLQIGDGGVDGAISGSLVDNGTVVFRRPNSVTFAGAISGNGTLIWSGPGTLTLTGDNAYSGATVINGPLVIDASGPSALLGAISGSGGLTQAGPGVLTLGGANTFSGGTTATAGLINFNSVANFGTSATPNITLNGGGLQWASGTTTDISSDLDPIGANGTTFDTNGNNVAFGTALTGAGGVTKAGAGILTLTTANAYAGGTTVTGGLIDFDSLANFDDGAITLNGGGLQWSTGTTLDISSHLTALGANGGTFDTNANNVMLATAISGAGGVTKAGPGTLTLTPVETYTGATVVSGGTLLVNGSIAASSGISVQSGATLGGSGAVPTLSVLAGGTVAPGAAGGISTLTVDGSAKFAAGSIYAVNISALSADKLLISGSANLGRATLQINPTGSFALGRQYTVLTATGELGATTFGGITTTGSFGTLANGAALVPVATYDMNDAFVTIDAATISPFLPSGASRNQMNVAGAVDAAMTGGGAVATFAPLATLSPAGLESALAGFSGEVAASAQDQAIDAAGGFIDVLTDAAAVGSAAWYTQTGARSYVRLADNGPVSGLMAAPDRDSNSGFNLWGNIGGAANDASANAKLGTHATNAGTYGGVVGLGYRAPDDRATIGLALGYSDIDWTLADTLGKGRAVAYQGGVYGAIMYRQAYISAQAMIASYAVTTTRTVSFGGTNIYQGKVSSNSDGIRLELGRRFAMDAGWLSPYLSGSIAQLDTPLYSETTLAGSSTFALNYASAAHTDTTSELGAAYDSGFGSTSGELLTLHARLGWLHDYAAGIRDSATFSGFTTTGFTVYGASPSKDAAHLVFGVEQDWDGLALTLDAQGLLGKSSRSFGGNAGIAYRM